MQFLTGLRQDSRDIQRDVAYADDGHGLRREIPGALKERIAVVEAHEFACAEVLRQVRSRSRQCAVADGTGGEDDGVVMLL